METEKTKMLAERIALLLQEDANDNDNFLSLRLSIEKIKERLANIEAKIETQNSNGIYPSSFRLSPLKTHPSQEKFQVAEAVAQEIIEHLEMEKACPYEPTGKPCDHCAMCSSRGF